MKHTKKHRNSNVKYVRRPAYPNAADAGYFTGKLLQILTAVLSGMGFVSAMLLLVTLA